MTGKGTPALTAAARAGITTTVHDLGHLDNDGGYGRAAAVALGVDAERCSRRSSSPSTAPSASPWCRSTGTPT